MDLEISLIEVNLELEVICIREDIDYIFLGKQVMKEYLYVIVKYLWRVRKNKRQRSWEVGLLRSKIYGNYFLLILCMGQKDLVVVGIDLSICICYGVLGIK